LARFRNIQEKTEYLKHAFQDVVIEERDSSGDISGSVIKTKDLWLIAVFLIK
jgi:hypothetical protein